MRLVYMLVKRVAETDRVTNPIHAKTQVHPLVVVHLIGEKDGATKANSTTIIGEAVIIKGTIIIRYFLPEKTGK